MEQRIGDTDEYDGNDMKGTTKDWRGEDGFEVRWLRANALRGAGLKV